MTDEQMYALTEALLGAASAISCAIYFGTPGNIFKDLPHCIDESLNDARVEIEKHLNIIV